MINEYERYTTTVQKYILNNIRCISQIFTILKYNSGNCVRLYLNNLIKQASFLWDFALSVSFENVFTYNSIGKVKESHKYVDFFEKSQKGTG